VNIVAGIKHMVEEEISREGDPIGHN